MSGVAHLVKMANDIGDFFASEPDREAAIAGIAGHIRRYWEPRMRRQIYAHLAAGGEGLGELAREAVARLAQNDQVAAAAPSAW
jgi:formate dehydrogenase subunit delta